jgi:hypothetical protein
MSIFVDDEDMVVLTGFKNARKQIDQLRAMGVPFRVSAAGRPVVAIAAIEGTRQPAPPRQKVTSPILGTR